MAFRINGTSFDSYLSRSFASVLLFNGFWTNVVSIYTEKTIRIRFDFKSAIYATW